eukprot:CAMPEP_0206261058 /NCGR_PEP_ID=MMETSP0047_2-20121206/27436_1 /ASSEMBLY_ACC=CAM_ASM_000192 /TAXON_ID=195065 /ORGANISM="Chroomonas mesostigmatica_cf, Strain CCMP1168" /LENGTH=51 /DNA_ID=CAMNT_0053688215 /DNA_START=92 /DNA_END=243 /DNA_ORIENTATION=-
MVEGHSVHRVAVGHAKRLVGRAWKVTSPNKRCSEWVHKIDGRTMSRIEAIG